MGLHVGVGVGDFVGSSVVGSLLGSSVVGVGVGDSVGSRVVGGREGSLVVGVSVGVLVGAGVGGSVGVFDGLGLGGLVVGRSVGVLLGAGVGGSVGVKETGSSVGVGVGASVGVGFLHQRQLVFCAPFTIFFVAWSQHSPDDNGVRSLHEPGGVPADVGASDGTGVSVTGSAHHLHKFNQRQAASISALDGANTDPTTDPVLPEACAINHRLGLQLVLTRSASTHLQLVFCLPVVTFLVALSQHCPPSSGVISSH